MASHSMPLSGSAGRSTLQVALVALVLLSSLGVAAMIWGATDQPLLAGVFLATFCVGTGLVALVTLSRTRADARPGRQIDWNLVLSSIEDADASIAITDVGGRLVCANRQFQEWFNGLPTPPALPLPAGAEQKLIAADRDARRDGGARIVHLPTDRGLMDVIVRRSGDDHGHLIWRFKRSASGDGVGEAMQ
ncbi:MAG: hybrid sensor histidine kinase/response regulator [Rhizorhabdus sp.]|nr:hybrid sensor histidine kinase/response regulator [Rhizorhabdus sp.]